MPRCPYLNEQELCSIYEDRPQCCRAFPNVANPHFCSDSYRCDLNCTACVDKCCKNIYIAVSGEAKPQDFIDALNIPCENCNQKWV